MALWDRFKKDRSAEPRGKGGEKRKKVLEKQRKQKEEEAKKRQFMAVGSAAPEKAKEAEKKGAKAETPKKPRKLDTKQAPRVLIKPLITEKATSLGVYNQYVFAVSPFTNKIEIKKAIKNLYGVTPFKVNIVRLSGKKVRYGRSEGRTKNWKKAIVTLVPGQKIDVYSV